MWWVIINLGYLAFGYLFFIAKFDFSDLNFSLKHTASPKMNEAYLFVMFYSLVPPTFIHGLTVVLRVSDVGFKKFAITYKVFSGVFILGLVLMIGCTFVFLDWRYAAVVLSGIGFVLYCAAQVYLFFKNDFVVSPISKIINQIAVFLLVIFSLVFSIFSDNLNGYEGVSFSTMTLCGILWLYAIM